MRVLVVEREPGSGDQSVSELEDAGHDVVRCVDADEASMPCKGMPGRHDCPLDQRPVDVALAIRGPEGGPSTEHEAGIRCALRTRIPVMVVGSASGANYEPWVDEVVDMTTLLDRPVTTLGHVGFEPIAAATRTVVEQVVTSHGLTGHVADVQVFRDDDRLVINVMMDHEVDAKMAHVLAARVVTDVRSLRPEFARLDVGVVGPHD